VKETPAVGDGSGLAEALLGLEGFRVLAVTETAGELVVRVETAVVLTGCSGCGVRAVAHERREVPVRDLACFGRPVRLVWVKRRWRCPDPACDARTWTETSEHVGAQVVLTRRAGVEVCRQVGEHARPVSEVALEAGVAWATVMGAVIEHGTPLVDDPDRVGTVEQLGVDETSFRAANRERSTTYVTGLVDLQGRRVIDLIDGRNAADLRGWFANTDPGWREKVRVVATDLAGSYRAGLSPHLDHATRVADPFHVVRVANRALDAVRRRVQHQVLGHRGRKPDPLYRVRKLLLAGTERLDDKGRARLAAGFRAGDPDGWVEAAWVAKESVRDVYLAQNRPDAEVLLAMAIVRCDTSPVPEICALGATLAKWHPEILARFDTAASNGPTEGLNLCIKRVKRAGHGFRNFEHYRLRVLLHAGGVTWPQPPAPPCIRNHAPYSDA
jgi:transposase